MMNKIGQALGVITEAVERYKPVAAFGLFSGGHDSLCATHITALHPCFTAAAHINTGIGVEQTRDFVRETCRREGWALEERCAVDCGQIYAELVEGHGFPGPFHHRKMYNRLKERPLRTLIRDYKRERGDKILLISGGRSQESVRRMGHVEPIQEEGARIWVAPIHDWTKSDCNEYIRDQGIQRNPVVDLIHMSGECLCGAFVRPRKKGEKRSEEFRELAMWFPDAAAEIERIEDLAWKAGKPWAWDEERPPSWHKELKRGQGFLLDMASDKPEPMCWSCSRRGEDGAAAPEDQPKPGDAFGADVNPNV